MRMAQRTILNMNKANNQLLKVDICPRFANAKLK